MLLSNTAKYAVRACIYLALYGKDDSKIGIKKISESLEIPTPFLGKILQLLARNNLLNSTKGPHGGFSLAHKPEDISLYEIVKTIDGDKMFTDCLLSERDCKHEESHCALHGEYAEIRHSITQMFKSQNLKSLTSDVKGNVEKYFI